jgi:crotonobetainyl-CoA:carnitine CoA-transferase CaiB-like acyl-CoA transferase
VTAPRQHAAGARRAAADRAPTGSESVSGALAGVRVADLTGGLAGPVAGMLLADLGADVIKVHAPGRESLDRQPGRHMWDRGKRSVIADRSRTGDMLALDRLIRCADVVLVGTGGGAVSYDDLVERGHVPGQPAFWIVMPPYLLGETPWAGTGESAGLLFAWLGHAWSQSSYDDVPVDCAYPVALYMQGIWAASVAVALLAGQRLGRRVAPLAIAGGAHGGELVSPGGFAAMRDEPHVHRPGGPGGALPNYRCYRCADGSWLFLGAFTTAFIERCLAAVGANWLLGDPRVQGDPARVRLPANLVWIAHELDKIFATRSRRDWLDLLTAADVPAAAVGEPGHWLDHPQVRALGLRADFRNDAGQDIVMPGPLIGLSETPVRLRQPALTREPGITDLRFDWAPRLAVSASDTGAAGAELPLAGLCVLDLGTIIAGPYVTTLLGELGADVVKVERPPAGDEFRIAHGGRGGIGFSVYNRDQRSIVVDLRAANGKAIFDRLVAAADVVVDNYRAGVLARLGIQHDQLIAINPLVTSVSISAFGETGPLGRKPGFDPVIQALSGIMRAQGGPDENDSPVFLTVPINDVLAAGLGALGACAALLARTRTGRGQLVSVTLCASSCLLQSEHLVRADGQGNQATGGRDFAGPAPLDRLHRTADGWVRLAANSAAPSAEESAALVLSLGGLPAAEAIRRAEAMGIAAVRARQPRELTSDDQLLRHGLLAVLQRDDAGVARVGPGRWLEMPGLAIAPPGEAPELGEHSHAILAEIGLGTVEPGDDDSRASDRHRLGQRI